MYNNRVYDKLKNDVDNYLNTKSNQPPGNASGVARREAPEQQRRELPPKTPDKVQLPHHAQGTAPNFQRELKVQKQPNFDGDSISINGTKVADLQVQLKVPIKKKEVCIQLYDAAEPRLKFQLKCEGAAFTIVGMGSLHIKSNKFQEFKNTNKDKKVQWLLQNTYIIPGKDNVITINFPYQYLEKGTIAKPTLLDRLLQEDAVVTKNGQQILPLNDQKAQENKQETEENDDKIEFRALTKEDFNTVQRVRKSISQIKDEDKLTILTDVFKIKKQFQNPGVEKRLKCPIINCQKSIQQVVQLKLHIKKYHPELSKNGLQLNDEGVFQFSQKSIQFALIMGKMYPHEVKKIIKRMKTRQTFDV